MEMMIRNLKQEVQLLQQQVSNGGVPAGVNEVQSEVETQESTKTSNIEQPAASTEQPLSMIGQGSQHAKSAKTAQELAALQEERSALKENLLELQTEFDHYKLTKNEQVAELHDKVEKLDALQLELERLQGSASSSHDALSLQITQYLEQIEQLK